MHESCISGHYEQTKTIAYKNTNYNMSYAFSTKPMQVNDRKALKNT